VERAPACPQFPGATRLKPVAENYAEHRARRLPVTPRLRHALRGPTATGGSLTTTFLTTKQCGRVADCSGLRLWVRCQIQSYPASLWGGPSCRTVGTILDARLRDPTKAVLKMEMSSSAVVRCFARGARPTAARDTCWVVLPLQQLPSFSSGDVAVTDDSPLVRAYEVQP
jgi:hypothetical protein